jgi:hypothetical protein
VLLQGIWLDSLGYGYCDHALCRWDIKLRLVLGSLDHTFALLTLRARRQVQE